MGDRRNIIVEFDEKHSVALYSHWDGSTMREVLARALSRGRSRWTDDAYLARIIFCEMVAGEEMGETGYGIEPFTTGTTSYCEASPGYDLIVRPREQTVQGDDGGTGKMYGFEDFLLKFLPEPAPA